MSEHVLHMLARNAQTVPTRVCGLLAQRNIPVTGIHMTMPEDAQHWCIEVTVVLDQPKDVELVVNRMNRLVDVVTVIEAGAELRVTLDPAEHGQPFDP